MGSLMAGWSSPTRNSKSEKLQRNKSLIKGEIEAYWRTKKGPEEDQLTALAHTQSEIPQKVHGGPVREMQRSASFPATDEQKKYAGELQKNNCWWTRSNWAFLNEPPVEAMEGPSYKYAAQYHVADLGREKPVGSSEMMSY